ncbi:N-acetylneuraminate synthase family protein [Sediminibacterium sp. TEGAF015]|uniref:N-acetylneuraminate synthase family protein n=1 Tax=Sediminibacterium sp. TEGAF015 TaxID=575378 RepID=UPI0021FCBD08|nr:N-acetylneuraminate synthase family protein [Sediminibacterium sp. TEGAF015]BDQ13329.1 N-acetylneuraminate synthase [Sediminibacterium sp. TEGAF015]
MKVVNITKEKTVQNFSTPYIIAEIGANHNGDMQLAKKMIDAAVECGCDAVKFQSWTPDSIVSKEEYDRNQRYNDSAKKHFGSLREMVDKYYLRTEQHYDLESYCRQKNIDFCSTPFTNREVDLLEDLHVPFYKIASMDINNYDFLAYVAQKGKPVILSTGMSTLGEIETAIKVVNNAGNDDIVLLHCISIYPPLYEDIHLNNITMLQQTFGYPVGFSDHTIGYSIPLASVALGSCVIEKHFTLDKDLPGWDHEISANPEEMKIICQESHNIVKSLGNFKRTVSSAEIAKKDKFRRSAVAKIEINAGHIVSVNDLDFKRPGTGIQPEEIKYLIGRKVKSGIPEGELIKWEHFE